MTGSLGERLIDIVGIRERADTGSGAWILNYGIDKWIKAAMIRKLKWRSEMAMTITEFEKLENLRKEIKRLRYALREIELLTGATFSVTAANNIIEDIGKIAKAALKF